VQVDDSGSKSRKSRLTRKHVIIAVTCAFITLVVITGIVVGVKFFLDSSAKIVKVGAYLTYASLLPIYFVLAQYLANFLKHKHS